MVRMSEMNEHVRLLLFYENYISIENTEVRKECGRK